MNKDMPPHDSLYRLNQKGILHDHIQQLLALDPSQLFDIDAVTTQTGVPLVTLRAWERNYGIPSPWDGENTSKYYSARDTAIMHLLHQYVVDDQMSIKQAIIELIHNEYDLISNLNSQTLNIQLPPHRELTDLRDSLLEAVVKTSQANAAHILADAFALYSVRVVCEQLLQPVLAFSIEMCRRGIFSAATGTFVRVAIQRAYPFLIEACFSSEEASRYLAQITDEHGDSSKKSVEGQQQRTDKEITQFVARFVEAVYLGDRKAIDNILKQAFRSYDAEDACIHLLCPALSRLETLAEQQRIPAQIAQTGTYLLQQYLAYLLQSTPNLTLTPSILVGSAEQESSEIEAIMLALLWRRAGLQVCYIGRISSTSALLQQIQQTHPAFVYIATASHTSISRLAHFSSEIARFKNSPVLCFGGIAFAQAPTLAQNIMGIYLGSRPEEIMHYLETLLRLSPSLLPSYIAELAAPDIQITSFLTSDQNISILVGCTMQESSELGALKLALLWRRAGLNIHYIGCINSISILVQQVQQTQPDFVYISTALRISISRIAKFGKEIAALKNVHTTFCFGGAAFDHSSTLAQNVTGTYLGSQPQDITQHLAALLHLSPSFTSTQITEFMAPNSFLTGFQNEISAANTSQQSKEVTQQNVSVELYQESEAVSYPQEQIHNVPATKIVGWKGTIFYPGYSEIQKALPGLFFVIFPIALLAEVIWSIELRVHATFFVDIFIAAVLALIVANIFTLPEKMLPGLTFSTRWSLRLGILCYGLKFSFLPLLQSGLRNLVIVTTSVTIALAVSLSVGALLKVQPRLAALIGVGTGICGISATMATSPAIGARDEETAVALGTILCWGTTGLLLYPLISNIFHLSPEMYGIWTGATIHDLPQLIATAQQGGGTAALKAALFVKLIRVAFITIVVLCMNILFSVKTGTLDPQNNLGARIFTALKTFPLFVFGFFIIVFINTVVNVPAWLSGPLATWPTTTFPTTISAVFLMFAIISICARINRSAIKIAGVKALVLGLISWSIQSTVIFIIALFLPHSF